MNSMQINRNGLASFIDTYQLGSSYLYDESLPYSGRPKPHPLFTHILSTLRIMYIMSSDCNIPRDFSRDPRSPPHSCLNSTPSASLSETNGLSLIGQSIESVGSSQRIQRSCSGE